jgi:hypothetical protein
MLAYYTTRNSKRKKTEKSRKNRNGGLPIVNLHLYVDFGPKRASIFNFDALFEYIGFELFEYIGGILKKT